MLLEASPELGPHKFGFLKRQMAGRLRSSWQKRGCEVRNGFLKIIETEGSQEPTKVSLVTCEMRPDDENKLNFSVTAGKDTYYFQVRKHILSQAMSAL